MNWINLTSEEQVNSIIERSSQKPQVIFKHSTRCATSSLAKNRLERSFASSNAVADFHFLDLIQYRDISNKIADVFSVYHESPQVLLIRNGECIYDESHSGITMDDLVSKSN